MGIKIEAKYSDYTIPLDSKAIRRSFRELVTDEGKEVKALYTHLMANFTPKNRSRILRKSGSGRSPVSGEPGSIYTAVGTNRTDGPLVWLEAGTVIRRRAVSWDWQSKTFPGGGISVGTGRGRALGWGFYPGIDARNFRDDIIDRRYPRFVSAGNRTFTEMLQRAKWI